MSVKKINGLTIPWQLYNFIVDHAIEMNFYHAVGKHAGTPNLGEALVNLAAKGRDSLAMEEMKKDGDNDQE